MFRTLTVRQKREWLAIVLLALALSGVACSGSAPATATPGLPPSSPVLAPTLGASPVPNTFPPTIAPTDTAPTAIAPTAGASGASPSTVTPSSAPTSAPPGSPTTAADVGCNHVTFAGDVTLPDGSSVTAGQTVTKTWRVRNTGTCAWTGYWLVFVRGQAMTTTRRVPIPETATGATSEISVPLVAPTTPGTYTDFWDLEASNGRRLGVELWTTIRVSGGPAAAPTVRPGGTPTAQPSGAVDTQGVQVSALRLVPEKATFNDTIGFRVTLRNTSATPQTYRWFVKVYQCTDNPCVIDNLKPSIGESQAVESVLAPGSTEVEAPQSWHIGAGACNFIAVPHFVEQVSQGVSPIFQSNGTPLYVPFNLC